MNLCFTCSFFNITRKCKFTQSKVYHVFKHKILGRIHNSCFPSVALFYIPSLTRATNCIRLSIKLYNLVICDVRNFHQYRFGFRQICHKNLLYIFQIILVDIFMAYLSALLLISNDLSLSHKHFLA